ncbi:MAG: Calx-beta domain-containing protein [Kineosporiaceae bacterium]
MPPSTTTSSQYSSGSGSGPGHRRRAVRLAAAALAVSACTVAVGTFGVAAPAQARKAPKPPQGAVLPAAPSDVTALPQDGAVWVSWAVSEQEQAVNTRYVVTELASGRQKKVDATVWDAPRKGLLFRGLTDGTAYRFSVRAMNPYLGPPSAAVSVTPSRTIRVVGDTSMSGENDHQPASFPFTLMLSSPSPVDLDVHVVTTTDGTATPGVDFTPLDTVVTIPAGAQTVPVSVALLDDDEAETPGYPETIGIRAEGVVPGTAAWASGTESTLLQIEDYDDLMGLGTLVVEPPAPVEEGDDGWTVLPFTARLTRPAPRDLTIGARAYGLRVAGYGMADIDGAPFTVTIPKGGTTVDVPVRVRGDHAVEPDLLVLLHMSIWTPERGMVDARAEGTVLDDDGDTPQRGSDLAVEARTRGSQVLDGKLPETTIHVRNHGAAPATDVVLGFMQGDLRVATADAVPSRGTCTRTDPIGEVDEVNYGGTYPTRVHTCALGTLAPGEEATVKVTGDAHVYGTWGWQAWATSGDGTDANKNDNVDGASYLVPDPSGPQPDPWPSPGPILTGGKPDTEDTYRSVPTPPRDVQAVGLNGAVRVSWLPPVEDNNRKVNFYRVTDLTDGSVVLAKGAAVDPQGRLMWSLRRDNGRPVQVAIEAVNNVGRSRPSDPSDVARARAEAWLGQPVPVRESAGRPAQASVPVTVRGSSSSWATLRVRTTDAGTATAGEDFTPVDTTLQVPPHEGTWTGRVTVPLVDDDVVEPDETVGVQVEATDTISVVDPADEAGTTRTTVDALLPVLDDDTAPVLTVLDAPDVVEGDRGQANLVYPVVLSKASDDPVTVTFWGGAGTPDADGVRSQAAVRYDGRVRTVEIPAGRRTGEVVVPVFGDLSVGRDVAVPVRVRASENVTTGTDVAWGRVHDDDTAVTAGPDLRVRITKPVVAGGTVSTDVRVRNQSDADSASVGVRVVVAKAAGLSGVAARPSLGSGGICRPLEDFPAVAWLAWQCTMPKLGGGANGAIRVTGTLAEVHDEVVVAAATRTEPLADADLRDNAATALVPAAQG